MAFLPEEKSSEAPAGIYHLGKSFKISRLFFPPWCGLKISCERHFRNVDSSNIMRSINDVLALKSTAEDNGHFMASFLLRMLCSCFAQRTDRLFSNTPSPKKLPKFCLFLQTHNLRKSCLIVVRFLHPGGHIVPDTTAWLLRRRDLGKEHDRQWFLLLFQLAASFRVQKCFMVSDRTRASQLMDIQITHLKSQLL